VERSDIKPACRVVWGERVQSPFLPDSLPVGDPLGVAPRMYPLAIFDKDENLITEIFESPTPKIDMFSARWIMNSFLVQLWEKGYLKEELYVSAKLAASEEDK
jgi:hypothetical protein